MTPEQKARELIDKFENYSFMDIDKRISSFSSAKQCALIAVQERIDEGYEWMGGGNTEWEKYRYNYLQEVKREIEKL
jgi:hypothetical protein